LAQQSALSKVLSQDVFPLQLPTIINITSSLTEDTLYLELGSFHQQLFTGWTKNWKATNW